MELKPTRFGFGEALRDVGEIEKRLIVLGLDISSSVCVHWFAEKFPERFFSIGIAEQNAATIAAGLALEGFIPVFSTYGVFAAFRASDQIRISICYNNIHVIIGGAHAGISVGPDGATHQALEDIAVMRALPHMTVLSPCDANQTYLATKAAIQQIKGPVYVRFGREAVPNFTSITDKFTPGKIDELIKGKDVTIVATGHMVYHALKAAQKLNTLNISASVLNVHTIKPLDQESLIFHARKTGCVLTIEEHQIHGGLGSAVAECLSQHYPVLMKIMGMPDSFGESGQPEELLIKYGLHTDQIVDEALKLFKKK
ncbi:MAG: transketolase family protein [Bacteroidales bacterium]|nr:transketolase family protein [Bacteroidales bacterium]